MSGLKRLLPLTLRERLRAVRKAVRYRYRRVAMARAVARGRPMKIILGAAETGQEGWRSTNEQWLDITRAEDWAAVFGGRKLLTHVVAEHVFEHLTEEGARRALGHIRAHMLPHGRLRIAVPDGYHPDPVYLRHVGIAGIGDDAADHKQLLNVDSLSRMMREAGFETVQVEGYGADGRLFAQSWSPQDGYIWRSRQNSPQGSWDFVDAATSLIVDGTLR